MGIAKDFLEEQNAFGSLSRNNAGFEEVISLLRRDGSDGALAMAREIIRENRGAIDAMNELKRILPTLPTH